MTRHVGGPRHNYTAYWAKVLVAVRDNCYKYGMSWAWVALGLIIWACAAFAVIALCLSVRFIDARLGWDRGGSREPGEREPRPGAGVEVE